MPRCNNPAYSHTKIASSRPDAVKWASEQRGSSMAPYGDEPNPWGATTLGGKKDGFTLQGIAIGFGRSACGARYRDHASGGNRHCVCGEPHTARTKAR